jgi:hypothetical protein
MQIGSPYRSAASFFVGAGGGIVWIVGDLRLQPFAAIDLTRPTPIGVISH